MSILDPNSLMNKVNEIAGTVSSSALPVMTFTQAIQVVYPGSKLLEGWNPTEDGPIPASGTFWYGQKNGKGLGKSFVAVPIAVRNHALQIKAGEASLESFNSCSCHSADGGSAPSGTKTPDQENYHTIASLPKQQETTEGGKKKSIRNIWGSDVLLWIPTLKEFATIFLHSTNRSCIEQYRSHLGKFCKVRTFAPPSQFTFYLAECREIQDVSTLDPSTETWMPNASSLETEVMKFKNPTSRGVVETIDGRPR